MEVAIYIIFFIAYVGILLVILFRNTYLSSELERVWRFVLDIEDRTSEIETHIENLKEVFPVETKKKGKK